MRRSLILASLRSFKLRTVGLDCHTRLFLHSAERCCWRPPSNPIIRSMSSAEPSPSLQFVQDFIQSNRIAIFSKPGCPYCVEAKKFFNSLSIEPAVVEVHELPNASDVIETLKATYNHSTFPYVFVIGKLLGGYSDMSVLDAKGVLIPHLKRLQHPYEYDLLVIGGGSGGLACSKEAALFGAKVAVCDFVKPSPRGSFWGLGGTCVNVGCIPKKLMHNAALLGESLEDARQYGWEFSEKKQHNWDTLRDAVQGYIKSLNWGYRVQLRDKNVTYINAFAELVDAHTAKLTDRRGMEKLVTAQHFVIATGERPKYPDFPGAWEHCVSSDDVFSLPYCPGKTLVVGASYVALECGGFLHGLGMEVSIMVRSILLRGFDQEMAGKVGDYMKKSGIQFIEESVPTKVEKLEDGAPGLYRVHFQSLKTGETSSDTFNTVLLAIGREACTKNIGLEKLHVDMDKSYHIIGKDREQSSVENIYAIGDVLSGAPQLTPVAIKAGKLLAARLFGLSQENCDYENVATTVFTPLEYGACGLAEETAIARYGEENIEVYHVGFDPLEYSITQREHGVSYVKVICNKKDRERILGIHIVSPSAGEVIQGFAVAMKMRATKTDLDRTIGIHPTVSENLTTLHITKNSGVSSAATGC